MPGPELRSGCVPVEAEEVFDSLVGHLAGRGQPANRPGPQDWAHLYPRAADLPSPSANRWPDPADRSDLPRRAGGPSVRTPETYLLRR